LYGIDVSFLFPQLQQRRLEEQFLMLSDIKEEGGGRKMTKAALGRALTQAGTDKSEDEIAHLFELLDTNSGSPKEPCIRAKEPCKRAL